MLRKFHAHFAVEKEHFFYTWSTLIIRHKLMHQKMHSICLLLYCEIDDLSMCTYVWTILIRDRHV